MNTPSGIGFGGTLLIVFIVLKLTGNIAWSWWWVLSPIWISLAVFILLLAGMLIAAILIKLGRKY